MSSTPSHYGVLRALEDASRQFGGRSLLCGVSPPSDKDYKYQVLFGVTEEEEPVVIDYRPNLPEVFDQGERGSCVWATIARTLKAKQEIDQGDYPYGGLSAAMGYALTKTKDGIPDQEGTFPKVAFQVLKDYGVCPESVMPYSTLSSLPVGQVPSVPQAALDAAAPYKIKSYAQLCGPNDITRSLAIATIRRALKNEGPLLVALLVCENFIPAIDGTLPLPSGTIRGGHAVGIVGDLPERQCFILRNSWGKEWGIDGYAYIPYEWFTSAYSPTGAYSAWYVYEAWTATDLVVVKASSIIQIKADSKIMLVDGQQIEMDVAAKIIDNRLMVPVSTLSAAMGYEDAWDGSTQTATFIKPAVN